MRQFADQYQCQFSHTERERQILAAAERYVTDTEAYDRTVCTGPVQHGEIMPATGNELGLINRHAKAVFQRICIEIRCSEKELRAAIRTVERGA